MYIQITNRCNALCPHCSLSCTKKGSDMTRDNFIKALTIVRDSGDCIVLGGGEPTIHPLFWDFLGLALSFDDDSTLWLATNGSQVETSIRLAALAKRGTLGVRLSHDKYHPKIDFRVIRAFEESSFASGGENDLRDKTPWEYGLIKAGRARKTAVDPKDRRKRECACPDLFISPRGSIFACGCRKTKFGTVSNPQIPPGHNFNDNICFESKMTGL